MKRSHTIAFAFLYCIGSIGVVLAGETVRLATDGDDAAAATGNGAFATLSGALNYLGDAGGTIQVADGIYTFTESTLDDGQGASCCTITTPIVIESASGNAERVTFTRNKTLVSSARLFYLNHPNAVLRNVTLKEGGFNGETWRGGNVLVGHEGGLVEGCLLVNGTAGNANRTEGFGGGNAFLYSGRMVRSILTGGYLGHYRPYGNNLYVSGDAIVENCLITKGRTTLIHEASFSEGAVALDSQGQLINCTVVGNEGSRFSGIRLMSQTASVINCVIAGNTVSFESNARGSVADDYPNGVYAEHPNCFVNCATDTDVAKYGQINTSCISIAMSDFIDAANGNYRLNPYAEAIDAGYTYAESGAISTTDLDGSDRLQGDVDCGCYEAVRTFSVRGSASATSGVIPQTSTITFTATPLNAQGMVTYLWDFGDGTEPISTTESTIEHRYLVTGTFNISLTATDSETSAEASYNLLTVSISSFNATFAAERYSAITNNPINFYATEVQSASTVTYTWDFGDGTPPLVTTDEHVTHAYTQTGIYTVTASAINSENTPITKVLELPVTILPRDIYVKVKGAGIFPYDSPETAAPNPCVALTHAPDGCIIHVLPGTYDMKDKQVIVTNAVTLVGEGETPADTVLAGYGNHTRGIRNLRVAHPNALVQNLTLYGGFMNYGPGGNLYLSSGVVSNCVLSTGGSNSAGGNAGGAAVEGGVLTHCVITNSYLGNRGSGIVLYQKGGRVSNCLLAANYDGQDAWLGSRNNFSLVHVESGTIDNCTCVGGNILMKSNEKPLQMRTSDTAFKVDAGSTAINNVIADIRYYVWDAESSTYVVASSLPQRWTGSNESFVNCATDDANPINATCLSGSLSQLFANYTTGDLKPGRLLVNKGATVTDAPGKDLAGNSRLVGRAIDIGCYETQTTGSLVIIH